MPPKTIIADELTVYEFTCPDCGSSEHLTIDDVVVMGTPMCSECNTALVRTGTVNRKDTNNDSF